MDASTGPSLTIRPCRSEDLESVLRIEREAFPDPYDLSVFHQLLRSEPDGFLVADVDKETVGYVAAAVRWRRGTIYSIAVSHDYRRMGAARGLMMAELRYLTGRAGSVQLQVGVGNSAARALYESFSFATKGRISRYYPDGEDAVVMELSLKG